MPYFTEQTLARYAANNSSKRLVQENIRRASTDSRDLWVFLSHSHRDLKALDKATIDYIRVLLADDTIRVYIDSLDPTMPVTTTSNTASALKRRIRDCDKFVLVATENALASKWVPWELGFADPTKTLENVAVLPIVTSNVTWPGSEYFGLYSRIEDASVTSNYSSQPTPQPIVQTYDGKIVPFHEWLHKGKVLTQNRYF